MIFLLSNRAPAPVAFWPFGTLGSAVLGAEVLIAFGFGVLVGLMIQVPRRLRAHRRAKRAERELAGMREAQKAPAAADTRAAPRIGTDAPEQPGLPPIA